MIAEPLLIGYDIKFLIFISAEKFSYKIFEKNKGRQREREREILVEKFHKPKANIILYIQMKSGKRAHNTTLDSCPCSI